MSDHPASLVVAIALVLGAVAAVLHAVARLLGRNGNGGAPLTREGLRAEHALLEQRLNDAADARTLRAAAKVGAHVDDALAEVVEARTPPGRRA